AASDAGPVLDPDPRRARTVTLDLSIATGEDGGTFDPTDHGAFTRLLFDQMRDAGAPIGIGRYDEVRWWYTGEAFRWPREDVDEWRTVHLGLDLFAEPGTTVLAPLAGRIASIRDNADRLDYGPTLIIEHEVEDEHGTLRFWTLYGHLDPEVLKTAEAGRTVASGEAIGAIGRPPRNGDWAPHLHIQVIVDRLDFEGTFPGVAAPGQRDVWCALSPDPGTLLRIPGADPAPRPTPVPGLIEERERRLGPSLSLSYARPLHIVRGRGARLYDADGQPYLDCVNNVAHVGHAHPDVVAAASRQMSILETNTRYLHESVLAYAERLTDLLPDPLEVCYFVTSGTEANELALRMARTHTSRVGAVVLEGAYHGHACSVLNLSPYKVLGPGGKGLRPWVRMAPMPDPYRGRYRDGDPDLAAKYAGHVVEAAEALETEPTWFGDRPPGAAAFFHESLQSCGGQIPLPAGFLAQAYEGVRGLGAVCVADEVQVGFGRVGTDFWAFEEHGVVPDILTLGKPIGNGHPLAAVVTTRAIADSFDNGMEFFSTFGGNPVSCEIGLAVLDVIERERLQENAARVGGRLLRDLEALHERHPAIGDVRGRGLFLGIELVRDRETREPDAAAADGVVQRMRDRGILLSTDGPDHNVIKIKPPMVFSRADAELLVSRLDDVLSESAFSP
ncbi:MAG: aminotransferase class III-fold pyridoxal phosphate-dependent enzyme, partial [Gemmatimonadota bacterium]|nr:aminotransferase class III-fold pyridoxal phosphate-dependent enzyme [Gemmatimonadota bacterium]